MFHVEIPLARITAIGRSWSSAVPGLAVRLIRGDGASLFGGRHSGAARTSGAVYGSSTAPRSQWSVALASPR